MNKKAIVTGCPGQDASYLCEFLLGKGYEVHGVQRRCTRENNFMDYCESNANFRSVTMDICDASGVTDLVNSIQPDEYYNLAAMSHVGQSFKEPLTTVMVDGYAVAAALEAIRQHSPKTKFYQASTSELYGKVKDGTVLNEDSLFVPRSPYAAAKLYAHNMVNIYREAYGVFGCCGILFNHECFFSNTPIILRRGDEIDICYIASLIAHRKDISNDSPRLTKDYTSSNIEIWDGVKFVMLKTVSRKKLSTLEKEDQVKRVTATPMGIVETTPNHLLISQNNKKIQARKFDNGDELLLGCFPEWENAKECGQNYATLLGLLCGDGYINKGKIRLTNSSPEVQELFESLIHSVFVGASIRKSEYVSGFDGKTCHLDVSGISRSYADFLRESLYDKTTKHKKVPAIILNSSKECKRAFLEGYYAADGLKKDKCAYDFKSYTTNSPLLAQGVLFLLSCTTKQTFNINPFIQNDRLYYQVNLHSDDKKGLSGEHLKKPANSIKKIEEIDTENAHVYDIETETGVVMAGIGNLIVGNSPRRGKEFVTRKITDGIAGIKLGLKDKLKMGNIDAVRDWGHARDYVEAMHLMLQQDTPDDFVIATGKTATVKEAIQYVCDLAELNFDDVYEINKEFMRPADVPYLCGDSSKARSTLGWSPSYDWKKVLKEMYKSDLETLSGVVYNTVDASKERFF